MSAVYVGAHHDDKQSHRGRRAQAKRRSRSSNGSSGIFSLYQYVRGNHWAKTCGFGGRANISLRLVACKHLIHVRKLLRVDVWHRAHESQLYMAIHAHIFACWVCACLQQSCSEEWCQIENRACDGQSSTFNTTSCQVPIAVLVRV